MQTFKAHVNYLLCKRSVNDKKGLLEKLTDAPVSYEIWYSIGESNTDESIPEPLQKGGSSHAAHECNKQCNKNSGQNRNRNCVLLK